MRYLLAATLALTALAWSAAGAAAQSTSCRWVGEGVGLLCDEPSTGVPTLSGWEADGWTTVPAVAGLNLPAVAGGLSAYGRTFPPSHVTPPSSYYSVNYYGNAATQTFVVYGPGNRSHGITCTTQYWGLSAYRTCQ
jgi:hypothetical protein